MKRGKKYQEAVKKIDRTKAYTLSEAVALVKELSFAKFPETVEVSVKLSLKKSQSVRDTVVLPNQFSAQKKILVFAKGEKAQEALDAGADGKSIYLYARTGASCYGGNGAADCLQEQRRRDRS